MLCNFNTLQACNIWITSALGSATLMTFGQSVVDIFSSPEHKVLMMSYCDQSVFVPRRVLSTI